MEKYNLFETIPGQDYSRVENRCLEHNGCIVDVGCLYWDWSNFFIDKKRVIGIDPFETEKEGVELFKGVIGTFDGTMLMENRGIESTMIDQNSGEHVAVKKWKTFIKEYNIEKISVLKINIEGAEYDLLNSLDNTDFENIDQIAISFHHWIVPEWQPKTFEAIKLLWSKNYDIIKINDKVQWVLFIKK
jgi:FkbM family methyltransferase